ncbi:MAG: CCA tRNA nucleotidyltransferase [Planctomycetota bacterium]|jgi:poly(A) polymerase
MPRPDHTRSPVGRLAARAVARLQRAGHRTLFVGGAVRDMILGRPYDDVDVATSARPEEVAAVFPRAKPVGAAFGVMLVPFARRSFEVATFRTEDDYRDGRHPAKVSFADERADARRRDFTCNALFYDPAKKRVIDLVKGRADIRKRLLRAVGRPGPRFAEDHLRMLRAARFAAALGFRVEKGTRAAARRLAPRIARISAERIREELSRMITADGRTARRSLELVLDLGLLKHVLPGMERLVGLEQPERFHPEGDCWVHTLCCLDLLPRRPSFGFALAVLLHDIGKGVTLSRDPDGRIRFNHHAERGVELAGELCARLKTSGRERELVEDLIAQHMRFKDLPNMREGKMRRFLRSERFGLHLAMHRIDCLASHGDLSVWRFARRKLRELPPEALRPPRLVTGNDLLEMGFRQGPLIGRVLRELEEEQLESRVNTRRAALAWVRRRFPRGQK